MATLYKLTDENNETRNHTIWGKGVTHKATGNGKTLCSNGFIHAYISVEQAILLRSQHVSFKNPKLFLAEGEISIQHVDKVGCKSLTTIKQIEFIDLNLNQEIAASIFCVKEVYEDKKWNKWANDWLGNINRDYAAAYDDAYAAAYVAYAAAGAAAYADAYAAAGAITLVLNLMPTLNLTTIVSKAREIN